MLRYDKDKLRESLSNEDIIKLLHELGSENIIDESDSKGQIISNTICHNHSGGDMKLYYFTESKSFHCFTQCSCNFDVYDLVIRNYKTRGIELPFSAAVEWVAQKSGNSFGFGFGFTEPKEKETSSELAWMNRFNKKKVELAEPKVYSDKILDVFSKIHHPSFLEDNISHQAMDKFEVTYYNGDERVSIPHRHWKHGGIIGIRGRHVGKSEKNTPKYIPLTIQGHTYSYHISKNLYGYYECKEAIKRHRKIIIFESEKSVMQTYSYFGEDCYAVALSGSSLSQYQIDIILSTKELIEVQIALDKEWRQGDQDAEIRQMKKVLEIGRRFSPYVKTTVLWDTDGLIKYKDSPSDRGREIFLRLLEGKQEILNIE